MLMGIIMSSLRHERVDYNWPKPGRCSRKGIAKVLAETE